MDDFLGYHYFVSYAAADYKTDLGREDQSWYNVMPYRCNIILRREKVNNWFAIHIIREMKLHMHVSIIWTKPHFFYAPQFKRTKIFPSGAWIDGALVLHPEEQDSSLLLNKPCNNPKHQISGFLPGINYLPFFTLRPFLFFFVAFDSANTVD